MRDVERVTEPEHGPADAALGQALIGREHDHDHQGSLRDIFESKV
jgi:hypothetical protein